MSSELSVTSFLCVQKGRCPEYLLHGTILTLPSPNITQISRPQRVALAVTDAGSLIIATTE